MSFLLGLPLLPLVITIFVLVLVASLLLIGRPTQQVAASKRVLQYTSLALPSSPGMAVQDLSARERLLSPSIRRVLEFFAKSAPQRVRKATAADLMMAGSSLSPTMFLGIRGVIMFGVPLLGALVVLTAAERSMAHWAMLGIFVMLGRKLPTMWLRRRIKARQRGIDRALPYALDLMVACLEGGLSLDATLAKVSEQSGGTLSDEIRRTLQEITLGRPAGDALRGLGERTGAPDLKRLTENVVQAERMGISIVDAMRTLAGDSRIKRRQRAEEMARKAPIKMVPVLIFFILPALMGIVMTPAALLMLRIFGEANGAGATGP